MSYPLQVAFQREVHTGMLDNNYLSPKDLESSYLGLADA
jgi:hypothetical protein